MTTSSDDDRFDKIYIANRVRGVKLANRFVKATAKFPSLVGIGAEDIYDEALHKYYVSGAHREERDDHWPLLHFRITQAGRDALKKAMRQKRVPPGPLVSKDETNEDGEPCTDLTPPGPTELERLLDAVAIRDARARAADGNVVDACAVDAAYAYYVEQRTYRDIAEELESSEETARRRVERGLRLLADQLKPED